MMSVLVGLSIVILVSFGCCLTLELNELNLCDIQTEITVKKAFKFEDTFVVFLKINNNDTVYAIKMNEFATNVSINNEIDFRIGSMELWNDWNLDFLDGRTYVQIENFEDVFVLHDRLFEYVVFLKDGNYYRAQYDGEFERINMFLNTSIPESDDNLHKKIYDLFGGNNSYQYVTAMQFPFDNSLANYVFVYTTEKQSTLSKFKYRVVVLRNIISENDTQWVSDTRSVDFFENNKLVSAFYVTDYIPVERNYQIFYMMEILSNGNFKVKQIRLNTTTSTNNTTQVTISGLLLDVYSGHIKQLFQCPLMSTLTSTSITPIVELNQSLDTSSVSTYFTSAMSPFETSTTSGKQPNNKIWLYIIAAIILLLIIATIIFLVWCCYCRKDKQWESEESVESKSIPEDENKDIPSEERIIYSNSDEESIRSDLDTSDTGNQSPTESPQNPSGVSPQTQAPKGETKSTLNKKSLNKDYDETAVYSINGIKRYK